LKDVEFLSKRRNEYEKKGIARGANKELKEEYVHIILFHLFIIYYFNLINIFPFYNFAISRIFY